VTAFAFVEDRKIVTGWALRRPLTLKHHEENILEHIPKTRLPLLTNTVGEHANGPRESRCVSRVLAQKPSGLRQTGV